MKKRTLIAVASAAAFAAQAGIISNEGSTAPSVGIIAQNASEGGNGGNRELSYRSATIHSCIGQSFTPTASATAKGISLYLSSSENFATTYNANSFSLKVFAGDHTTGNTTALGTFNYDATVLGDGISAVWLRFDLGAGVAMTSGNTYSFLLTQEVLDADHRLNFRRAKNAATYAGGEEIRTGNLYDIANWETDPWDQSAPIGATATTASTGDLLFSVDTIPEPATLGLVAVFGGAVLFIRRRLSM